VWVARVTLIAMPCTHQYAGTPGCQQVTLPVSRMTRFDRQTTLLDQSNIAPDAAKPSCSVYWVHYTGGSASLTCI
jgi:hypothetical protein